MIVKRILVMVVLLIVLISTFFLITYEVTFNSGGYDILLINRITSKLDYNYGIDYKNGFEVWEFGENVHGGIAERRLFIFE